MNSVFENNFQAGFTPFSSLLVFKDFAFCLYGDVLRDGIHNDDLQPNRSLPACRRLLFPLLHAEKGRLRNAVANRVPAFRWQGILFRINCEIISG